LANIHGTIKYWGRKEVGLIEKLIRNSDKHVLDPFCGSGITGVVAIKRGISATLSDINPVAVFITHNLLRHENIHKEIYKEIKRVCLEVEKEIYQFNRGTLKEAVWTSLYFCPYCGKEFKPKNTKRAGKMVCRSCNNRFWLKEAEVKEYPKTLKICTDGGLEIITDRLLLRKYMMDCKKYKPTYWYPRRKFTYPNGTPFRGEPGNVKYIHQIFFRRSLFAASRIYNAIEHIWKTDKSQGDLLKLIFIASLASATKMLPNSHTSGPSWKLPRYWIPPEKVEINFCKAFLRRLEYFTQYKEKISEIVKEYKISAYYFCNSAEPIEDKEIQIVRGDAQSLFIKGKFDTIILDPPHYHELKYFELTYLWQSWLVGSLKDRRFTDFNYWSSEIVVNSRINKSVEEYNRAITKVTKKMLRLLTKKGRIVMILHSSQPRLINSTIKSVKREVKSSLAISKIRVKIPSSAQGIHGRGKNCFYIIRISN